MEETPRGAMNFISQHEYDEFVKLLDKYNTTNHSFKRWVVLLASGSLSVISNFQKSSPPIHSCRFFLFCATLILIGTGILTLAISLYGDVKSYHLALTLWWGQIQSRVSPSNYGEPGGIAKNKTYAPYEWIGYIALLLAVFAFVGLEIASLYP